MSLDDSVERESLLRSLGLSVTDYLPEDDAPEVDRERLLALARRELPEGEARNVCVLLATYRSWSNAFGEILAQQQGTLVERSLWQREPMSETVRGGWETSGRWKRATGIAACVAIAASVLTVAVITTYRVDQSFIYDGQRTIALHNSEILGLEDCSDKWQAAAQKALHDGIDRPAFVDELALALPAFRGKPLPQSTVLVYPVMTAVRDRQPVLRWEPMPGADMYRVQVIDPDGRIITESGWSPTTEWKVVPPLDRGSIYTWAVLAKSGDKEFAAPQAGELPAAFSVLTSKAADRITTEEKTLKGSALLHFLLYVREGLFYEAQRELAKLKEQNPKSAAIQKLEESCSSIMWGNTRPSATRRAKPNP